jgi:hypothetical protein
MRLVKNRDPLAGFCEHGDETLGSIKEMEVQEGLCYI